MSNNYIYNLSPKEILILELLVKDYTNKQISEELKISVTTVKTHVMHILCKLGLKSRFEIAYVLKFDKNHPQEDVSIPFSHYNLHISNNNSN